MIRMLVVSLLCCLYSLSAILLFAGELHSPRPAKLLGTTHFVRNFDKVPRWNSDQEFVERFGKTDGTLSFSSYLKDPAQHDQRVVAHFLFRNHELIYRQMQYLDGRLGHDSLRLTSNSANPNSAVKTPGEIFSGGGDFPVVGCIDGYFFEDYFPDGETQKDLDGEFVHLRGTSKYGRAQAWLDPLHSPLPKRIVIDKDVEHIIAANRRLGDIRFEKEVPESALISMRLELTVTKFGVAASGENFMAECQIVHSSDSRRGSEERSTTTWTVESIDFDPRSVEGKIYPEFDVADRTHVEVEGASQVPYVWSDKEQWAVPDVRFIADDHQLTRPTSNRFMAILLVIGLVCGVVVFRLVSQSRKSS